MTDAMTIVLRYEPVIVVEGRAVDAETARELWRDALTREVDELAERHGCVAEVHYEDITSGGPAFAGGAS